MVIRFIKYLSNLVSPVHIVKNTIQEHKPVVKPEMTEKGKLILAKLKTKPIDEWKLVGPFSIGSNYIQIDYNGLVDLRDNTASTFFHELGFNSTDMEVISEEYYNIRKKVMIALMERA